MVIAHVAVLGQDSGPLIRDFEELAVRLLIAILLPFLLFFTIGRPFAGIFCLILQITLVGWLPAATWAVYALSQYKTAAQIEAALGDD